MNIPSIIDRNYYVVKSTTTNSAWICEAKRFDDKENMLYYYYGTYELGSDEHKNNCYLSNSYYDILPSENDKIRLATPEEIDILMDILEKNGIVTTLQEAKDKAKAPDIKGEDYSGKRFGYKIPDGYEFDTIDNGKIILKPIKPKYPKTFRECRAILNDVEGNMSGYKASLFASLQDLLICRDAYWKIAGEEMGLGKPWESPLPSLFETVYCIRRKNNEIIKGSYRGGKSEILEFPTEEMRDAFYENFKELIESTKELL